MINYQGGTFDPAWVATFSWEDWKNQPYFQELNDKDREEALKVVFEQSQPPKKKKKEEE